MAFDLESNGGTNGDDYFSALLNLLTKTFYMVLAINM